METKRLISIPLKIDDAIKKAAKEKGQTITGQIKMILWEWYEKEKEAGNEGKG